MSHLHISNIKIVVGKHRTAHRTDEDSLILQAQFFDGLSDQLMRDAMAASRAVVGLLF